LSLGCDLAERDEDKGALDKTWMRDDKTRPANDEIAVEQNVEVEGAGAVGEAEDAVAAEVPLDEEQSAEKFDRCQFGFQGSGGVEEAGLIGEADRRG
jgi:hypothetical protein